MAYKNDESFVVMLAKIPVNEPIFLLRGRDMSAPKAILAWIEHNTYNGNMPDVKLREAFECALKMRGFQPKKAAD